MRFPQPFKDLTALDARSHGHGARPLRPHRGLESAVVSFVGIDSARHQREVSARYARGRHEFGNNINQFAKRSATPGSLYSYVTRGLGVNMGFLAGWCLILVYFFAGMALLSGAVNYAGLLLDMLHLHSSPAH